ncbi:RF-1 domain-containing protein [Amylocystis lapponica]|nr:RF-1 domain-containing protein [Amylocystis lapponica]
MSISPALLASARSAYRTLLRVSTTTFAGDLEVQRAFRAKIRTDLLPNAPPSDPQALEEKVKVVQEIADVLRKNVVQGVKVEQPSGSGAFERYKVRITEHTELGTNESIKDPPPLESSRSARKRAQTCDSVAASSNDASAPPRYYSQLKKAHKGRVVPELKEEDIEEAFVRGSGPGGQSINKTENNVQLLHKPTGLRVACQETRSLSQNRKLARRILLEKLDALRNPGLSKQGLRKARQLERERRRKKKAKKQAAGKEAEKSTA